MDVDNKIPAKVAKLLSDYGINSKKLDSEMMAAVCNSTTIEYDIARRIYAGRLTRSMLDKFYPSKKIDEQVDSFIRSKYAFNIFSNIEELKDIDKAVKLILNHLEKNSHICIVTDYDSDGVNSAASLHWILSQHIRDTSKLSVIINKRATGNGFSTSLISRVMELHNTMPIGLIITADHGSANNDAFAMFKRAGIDTCVTDHHQIPRNGYPDQATVFVNPQRDDSQYPKDISGCVVAILVGLRLWEIAGHLRKDNIGISFKDWRHVTLYAMISTITDVMSMSSPHNRWWVTTGLVEYQSGRHPAVSSINTKLSLTNVPINERTVGYIIGPYINAANRLGVENTAYNLLAADTLEEADKHASFLAETNITRKTKQKLIAEVVIEETSNYPYSHSVVAKIATDMTITGVIAGMVGGTYNKPCVCFNNSSGDTMVGSGRSIVDGVDLSKIIDDMKISHPDILVSGGGHKKAAGFNIRASKYDEFCKIFDSACAAQSTEYAKHNIVSDTSGVDGFIRDISIETPYILDIAGPYGEHWPRPVIATILTFKRVLYFNGGMRVFFTTRHGIDISCYINGKITTNIPEVVFDKSTNDIAHRGNVARCLYNIECLVVGSVYTASSPTGMIGINMDVSAILVPNIHKVLEETI